MAGGGEIVIASGRLIDQDEGGFAIDADAVEKLTTEAGLLN